MSIFNMVGGGGSGYKTYTQLKAMSLSDVITELNTDAQGYYDNLNGNGHIIGIGIANDDKTTYQCWDVSPIIYWNGSWRNGEIIIVEIKADSNGDLKIPVAGYNTFGNQGISYNWWVSVDGGSETQYSGTGSAGSITIASGLTADSDHTIVIRPNSESYLWARAFGFYNSGVQTLLQSITYDGSYKGYGDTSTNTSDYFRGHQYRGCTSLTTVPTEVLPTGITSIGNYFRSYQYRDCTSLTTAQAEVLPNTVTSIGDNFRNSQYNGCTSLTTAPQEVLPTGIESIGNSFRSSQYNGCTSLTTAQAEVLPNTVTSIGNNFRNSQYNGCTSLKTAVQEVLSSSLTSIGGNFRKSQYDGCTSLTTAAQEILPNSLTTIGNYFRNYQYNGCTSLTTVPTEALPNSLTTIGTNFRSKQYYGCTNLTIIEGLIDLSIGNTNYRYQQFYNCNSNKTVKVLGNVGYAWSTNTRNTTYISVVLVPSAYLQNYIDATTYPRSDITDSKFVLY